MGMSPEEIFSVLSNLAGATSGSTTTRERAGAANASTQSALNAKYAKDLEKQKEKERKAGVFGAAGSTLGSIAGQILIPIPGVGAAIGGAAGGAAGNAIGGGNAAGENALMGGVSGFQYGTAQAGSAGTAPDALPPMDTSGQLTTGKVDPNALLGAASTGPTAAPASAGLTQTPAVTGGGAAPVNMGPPPETQPVAGLGGFLSPGGISDPMSTVQSMGDLGSILYNAFLNNPDLRFMDNKMMMPVDPSQEGINSYASGTPYIPEDQIALVHKGEAVFPAAQNPFNPSTNPMSSLAPVSPIFDFLLKAAANTAANVVDPTVNALGKAPNPVGASLSGAGDHQVMNQMNQQAQATGVGQSGPIDALMGGGAPGAPISGTNQTVQLTPEAQKKKDFSDKLRNIDPAQLMSMMKFAGDKMSGFQQAQG